MKSPERSNVRFAQPSNMWYQEKPRDYNPSIPILYQDVSASTKLQDIARIGHSFSVFSQDEQNTVMGLLSVTFMHAAMHRDMITPSVGRCRDPYDHHLLVLVTLDNGPHL